MKLRGKSGPLFFFVLGASGLVYADDCIQYNFRDKYTSFLTEQSYSLQKSAICKDSITTVSQAQNAEHNAGITAPFDDVVFQLTYGDKSSSSNFGEWKVAFCASQYNEAQHSLNEWQVSEYFGNNELSAVKACYGAASGTFTVDPEQNQFQFSYKPGSGKEKLYRAYIEPSSSITAGSCTPNNPFDLGAGTGLWGKDISGQTEEVSCGWTGQPLHITLLLNSQGHRSYNLPSISQPTFAPPPPPPVPAPAPHVFSGSSNTSMQKPFTILLDQDARCTVTENNGMYKNGYANGAIAHCPPLSVYDGGPGKKAIAESNEFDNEYKDNDGVCTYVFSCVPLNH